jgi:hypothetical protein
MMFAKLTGVPRGPTTGIPIAGAALAGAPAFLCPRFLRGRHPLSSLNGSPAAVASDDSRNPGAQCDLHPLRAFFMPVWP